ncbi:MAG: type II secretion system F family protein [Providencia heimbachae]|nr:type II secretion system F family protein [Providencia heimbachae]
MFIYSYISLSINNVVIHDTLIAKNKKHAYLSIIDKNQIPLKIKLKNILILNTENLNYKIHFFHQLKTLISSGINILKCLRILKSNCHLPFWRDIISHTINGLEKGETLSSKLKEHSNIFDSTTINLIVIAEKTGQYEESFRIITSMLEHNQKTSLLIKKALRYPITISIFSFILLSVMIIFVIPQFEDIYTTFQHELPFLTQIMISISSFIREKIHMAIILLIVSFLFIMKYKNSITPHIKKSFLLLPYINQMTKLNNLTIYFLTLSSTIKAGLPLAECLKCSIETSRSPQYTKEIQNILLSIIKGDSLSVAMKASTLFPTLSIQLISIAEETDKLHYFTDYLFKYYSDQYISITEKKLKSLEPILLALIAVLVGVIMLAMYLPIFNLGNVITGI